MEILEDAVSENMNQNCKVTVSQLLNGISAVVCGLYRCVCVCVFCIGVRMCVKCWLGGMNSLSCPLNEALATNTHTIMHTNTPLCSG